MVEGRTIPFCCLYGDTEHSDRDTLLSVSLTRQAGLPPLGEYLTGFVEHGFDGFQLCAGLVKLQLVFHVLDLRDRQSTIQTRGYKHSPTVSTWL